MSRKSIRWAPKVNHLKLHPSSQNQSLWYFLDNLGQPRYVHAQTAVWCSHKVHFINFPEPSFVAPTSSNGGFPALGWLELQLVIFFSFFSLILYFLSI